MTEHLKVELTQSPHMPSRWPPRRKTLDTFIAMVSKDAFNDNLARVGRLIEIYRSVAAGGAATRTRGASDVLRAAVVLLHATLEELLRQIAPHRIATGGEAELNEIPLKGMPGRAERFLLGKLAAFRDSTVDDVINVSVDSYYQSSVTFNGVADIASVLRKCRINDQTVRRFYPMLAEMIKRRHQIVHRVDVGRRKKGDGLIAQPLDAKTVKRWLSTTRRFGDGVLTLMAGERIPGFNALPEE
jgi:hypothetical protein